MPILFDRTAYMHPCVELDLSKIVWDAIGEPSDDMPGGNQRCHLTATVNIGGALHHLTAIEVKEEEPGITQIGAPGVEREYEELSCYQAIDGAMHSVEIEGRRYVLSMVPFSE